MVPAGRRKPDTELLLLKSARSVDVDAPSTELFRLMKLKEYCSGR